MKSWTVILLVLVAWLILMSLYVVKEYETGIKFRLGEIIETDIQPGLHLKMPFINNVRKFDRRILELDMQPEEMNTSEQKYVDVDYFVNWRIVDPASFYVATQGGDELIARSRLSQIIRDRLRDEFAQRTLTQVISVERSALMERLTDNANEVVGDLGIEVVDVRIKRIELTSQVLDSVFQRMRTQRTEYANELRSLGREQAELITATADREVRILLAEAQSDAERTRGEGDAEATRIYAEAYNRDTEFYRFNRSLQAYRQAFGSGQDTLVLDPESEFFDYFRDQQADQ